MGNKIIKYERTNLIKIIEKANTLTSIQLFNTENRINLRTLGNTAHEETVKLLSIIILRLFGDMNIEKNITAEWFQELAGLIMERFIILSIEDIIKCFRNIKAGDYGKNYNNFTMSYIIDCIGQYEDDLIDKINQQHDKKKKDIIESRNIEEVKKLYERLKAGEIIENKGANDERAKYKEAHIRYLREKGIKG